jgi:hypothetical protein
MTDKTDKAAAAAAAKVEDKQDAAYEKYEGEQATYEKKHPGEINEPAYAKYEAAYDKAEGAGVAGDPGRAEAQKKYDAALAEVHKLSEAAAVAHAKADKKEKTSEQLAAEEADKKADDARAKAADLHPDKHAPATPAKPVKRGNDPANPAYAPGVPTHDEAQTVRLSHVSADHPEPVFTMVHPDMVGDYLRAGWSRARDFLSGV